MKQGEVMGLLQRGKPLVMGEFRRRKIEIIRWRDKATGKAMEAPAVRDTVETDDETFEVSPSVFMEIPDGKTVEQHVADLQAQKVPFSKGAKVLVEISRWEPKGGVVSVRGTLYPIENS